MAGACDAGDYGKSDQVRCFEPVTLALRPDDEEDQGDVEVLPRLRWYVRATEDGVATKSYSLSLVPTTLRRGTIRLGKQEAKVVLAHTYSIHDRYDSRSTRLFILPIEHWWGADDLSSVRSVDGTFYSFSTTPDGYSFTVHRYDGDLGVFEIGAGPRKLDVVAAQGSLRGPFSVPVGDLTTKFLPKAAQRTVLPVGDYYANLLHVVLAGLEVEISHNYHSDGHPRDRGNRPIVHGFKIRKETPFILDFRNEPQVMFASPAADQRFKRGETVEVMAVLTDPVHDFMIRGLTDSRESTTEEVKSGAGETHTYKRPKSLDPQVSILNASGELVATGVMPFG
ncbi:MAG: hypothetical protein AB1486_02035 [Planctomycetota bacterium]